SCSSRGWMADLSWGCLTRIFAGELPYLRAFVEHHARLGCSHVALLHQDPDLPRLAARVLAGLESLVRFTPLPPHLSPDEALRTVDVAAVMPTDLVLLVDGDEFLRLPPLLAHGGLTPCFGSVDSLFLPWVMACSDFDPGRRRYGFYGCNGKTLARTDRVVQIRTPHRFSLRPSPPRPWSDQALLGRDGLFLVHLWARSFEDVLIRCLYGAHPGCRSAGPERMRRHCQEGTLPGRLRFLAALSRHDCYYRLHDPLEGRIDHALEHDLIAAHLAADEVARLADSYRRYRDGLEEGAHIAPFPVLRKINQAWLDTLP
ncbi:MAG: hypothetical protein VKN17_07605, partial [Cyanobacteriota bacterium]|nr:hypothetical protein [Cyanobacteriota bacterium]